MVTVGCISPKHVESQGKFTTVIARIAIPPAAITELFTVSGNVENISAFQTFYHEEVIPMKSSNILRNAQACEATMNKLT